MKKLFSFCFFISLLLLLFLVYKAWFLPGVLSAGDFRYIPQSSFTTSPLFPYAWDSKRGAGLGGSNVALLWNTVSQVLPVTFLGKYMGLPWDIIQRVIFFYPFLLLSGVSSYLLSKKICLKDPFTWITVAINLLNTYILMLVGGGQITIALSYAFLPLVFLIFKRIIDTFWGEQYGKVTKIILIRDLLIASLALSGEVLLDTRIAFIVLLIASLYFLFVILYGLRLGNLIKIIYSGFLIFAVPLFLTLLMHAFWILPTVLYGANPVKELGVAYSTTNAVAYFSFAFFENTFSLLHPNWPENIFGKVGFMKPEFLMLPLLAYTALFFITDIKDKKLKKMVLFFAFLGLLGAFLAKGAKEPFGEVYIWLFYHIPGFNLFRDPTKWYLLITLSYSVLIPVTLCYGALFVQNVTHTKKSTWLVTLQKNTHYIFSLIFLVILGFLLRPALTNHLTGTLQQTPIPAEYMKLEMLLSSQSDFYRTFWVPQSSRFSYTSFIHPLVSGQDFYQVASSEAVLHFLQKKEAENQLQEAAVKYVIVPYDTEGEIFLRDRKYDEKLNKKTIIALQHVPWLTQLEGFGQLAVFSVPEPKSHFWLQNNSSVSSTYITPTHYVVSVQNAHKGDRLIFSENYDRFWQASIGKKLIPAQQYQDRFNSFVLTEDGSYTFNVEYTLQKWVERGMIITLLNQIAILMAIGYISVRSRMRKTTLFGSQAEK